MPLSCLPKTNELMGIRFFSYCAVGKQPPPSTCPDYTVIFFFFLNQGENQLFTSPCHFFQIIITAERMAGWRCWLKDQYLMYSSRTLTAELMLSFILLLSSIVASPFYYQFGYWPFCFSAEFFLLCNFCVTAAVMRLWTEREKVKVWR